METSGISKYWKKGEDDRFALLKSLGMNDTVDNRRLVDFMLDGLLRTIRTRRRTKFVGIGVFEWRKWNHPVPGKGWVDTMKLVFKLGRYVRKYEGRR